MPRQAGGLRRLRDVLECDAYWMHELRELWFECLKEFKAIYQEKRPGAEPFLVTDNLGAHRKISILKWCILNKVHVVFLPPDVTHFMNPLDDMAFTSFKSNLTREVRSVSSLQQLVPRRVGSAVLDAALAARAQLTPAVLKASWERVGPVALEPRSDRQTGNQGTNLEGWKELGAVLEV